MSSDSLPIILGSALLALAAAHGWLMFRHRCLKRTLCRLRRERNDLRRETWGQRA